MVNLKKKTKNKLQQNPHIKNIYWSIFLNQKKLKNSRQSGKRINTEECERR